MSYGQGFVLVSGIRCQLSDTSDFFPLKLGYQVSDTLKKTRYLTPTLFHRLESAACIWVVDVIFRNVHMILMKKRKKKYKPRPLNGGRLY